MWVICIALYNYVVLPWMRDSVGRMHVHIITLYTLSMTLCKNMMVFIYCVVFGMYVYVHYVKCYPSQLVYPLCYLDPSHGVGTGVPIAMCCMLPPSHGVGTGVPIDMCCMLPPSHGVGTGVPIDMCCMLPPSHGVGTGVPIDMWCMLPPSHGVGTGVPIAMWCMLPPSHGVGTGVPIAMWCMLPPSHGVGTDVGMSVHHCSLKLNMIRTCFIMLIYVI